MPVTVHVPSRLRVDAAALDERMDEVEDALTAAATRALRTSCEQVLGPRAGFVSVRLHPPVVTWTGAGATDVPEAVRRALEDRLALAVLAAADGSGVHALGARAADAVVAAFGPASETVDPGRLDLVLRTYALPAYDSGRSRSLPVRGGVAGEPIEVVDWAPVRSPAEMHRLFAEELAAQRIFTPASGYLGAIFRRGGRYVVVVDRFPLAINVLVLEITEPQRYDLGPEGRLRRRSAALPAGARYRLSFLGVTHDAAGARRMLHGFYAQDLADEVRARAKRLTKYDDEASVALAVEQLIDELTEGGPWDRPWHCAVLEAGALRWLVWSSAPIPEDLDTELVPLVRSVERPGGDGDRETPAGDGDEEDEAAEAEPPPAGEEVAASFPPGFAWTADPGQAAFGPSDRATRTRHCAPYLDEPPVASLGPAGEGLAARIEWIAANLQIPPCEFAGAFCLDAASALEGRARQVARAAVPQCGRLVPAPDGGLHGITLVPVASAELQLLRHLATVAPALAALSRDVTSLYLSTEGPWRARAGTWSLRFNPEIRHRLTRAVGVHFAATCRVLFVQMLRASALEIAKRRARVAADAPAFAAVVVPQLMDLDELKQLRARLYAVMPKTVLQAVGETVYTTWRDARRAVVELEDLRNPFSGGPPPAAGVILGEGTSASIVDRHGAAWRLADLDRVIGIRESIAGDVDPIARQIIDDPVLWRRFLAPDADLEALLAALLDKMQRANDDITARASASFLYALRMGSISRDDVPARVGRFNLELRGIHLAAHEAIVSYYAGDAAYEEGLRALFGREIALEEAVEFFEFGRDVLLAIRFPPAAIVAGARSARAARERALERARVFRALIDPEVVLSRFEVEAELFAAELAGALTFIPAAGRLLGRGRTLIRFVARRGAVAGTQRFVRYASRGITRQIAHELQRGLVLAIAREAVQEQFEDVIVGRLLIEPAIAQLRQEFESAG